MAEQSTVTAHVYLHATWVGDVKHGRRAFEPETFVPVCQACPRSLVFNREDVFFCDAPRDGSHTPAAAEPIEIQLPLAFVKTVIELAELQEAFDAHKDAFVKTMVIDDPSAYRATLRAHYLRTRDLDKPTFATKMRLRDDVKVTVCRIYELGTAGHFIVRLSDDTEVEVTSFEELHRVNDEHEARLRQQHGITPEEWTEICERRGCADTARMDEYKARRAAIDLAFNAAHTGQ